MERIKKQYTPKSAAMSGVKPNIVVMLKGVEESLYFHCRGATMWWWANDRLQIIDGDGGALAEFPADGVLAVYHSPLACPCPCVDQRGIEIGHPIEDGV